MPACKVVLDCDPGHDDAIAIMLACASPEIELVAVTTVAGNVTLEHTTRNALRVLDLIGRADIPVAAGRDRPLFRDLSTAAVMHGESGLAGPLEVEPSRGPSDLTALQLIEQVLVSAVEPVTLVATGPLTNIADVITQLPEIHARIREIVIMGGAVELGNWTPAAEFNIWVDPDAAKIVFESGISLTMIGLEVTHKAWLTNEHADQLRGSGRPGEFVAELLDHFVKFHQDRFGWPGAPIHDAVTIAHLIDPTLVTTLAMNVQIDTNSSLCMGRTVADRWSVTGLPANVHVGLDIDRDRFVTLLLGRLSQLA
ncbi:MAG: nucleoside hydrolase [Actinobacteria bacterium]|nr:nucleoside hydrolase [Actinomycetota bacterium]